MAIKNSQEREEVMKARTHTRWTKRVALGLAVAAIAAPAAQGAYEPLYQHTFQSNGTAVEPMLPSVDELQQFRFTPGQQTHPFSFTPSNEPVGPTVVIPDPTRGLPSIDDLQQFRFTPGEATHPFSFTPSNEPVGPTVVIPNPTRGLPSIDDLQQFRFTPDTIVTPVASAPSSGIDWTDAGIGAGMALGAILLGAAAALGLRRRGLAHS
jgi:hypothetical protein